MKKKFLLFASALTLLACEQNDELNGPVTENTLSAPLNRSTIETGGITEEHEMLVFQDHDSFKATLDALNQESNNWNQAFIEEWGHLGDDEFNYQMEASGFDPYEPYQQFESNFGYTSLRSHVHALEDAWLDNSVLVEDHDPNRNVIPDPNWRTLLNEHGEIMIDGAIHIYKENEGYYIISDANFEIVDMIRDDQYVYSDADYPGVVYAPAASRGYCVDEEEHTKIHNMTSTLALRSYTHAWVLAGADPSGFSFEEGQTTTFIKATRFNSNSNKWERFYPTITRNSYTSKWVDGCNGPQSVKSLGASSYRLSGIPPSLLTHIFISGDAKYWTNSGYTTGIYTYAGTSFSINM